MHGLSYRVKPGDSLSSIAQQQLGRAAFWPRIYVYNNRPDVVAETRHRIRNPDQIRAGQLIVLPPTEPFHHPHLRSDLETGRPHRQQATRPSVTVPTQPAAAPPTSVSPSPAIQEPGSAGGADTTRVNSFPLKYILDLIPEQRIEGPNFEATVKVQGQIVIWADEQIPLVAFTNKGAEIAAKQQTDGVLGKLLTQTKISFDPSSRKVTFENVLTSQAKGAPPSVVAVGVAADSSNPVPALRAKFIFPTLQGRLGRHLFIADSLTVIVDIRPRVDDRDPRQQPSPVASPVVNPVTAPVTHRAWWEGPVAFVERHSLEIGAGVLITAAIASNFVTFGADTPVDMPAAAGAAAMLRTAGARAR